MAEPHLSLSLSLCVTCSRHLLPQQAAARALIVGASHCVRGARARVDPLQQQWQLATGRKRKNMPPLLFVAPHCGRARQLSSGSNKKQESSTRALGSSALLVVLLLLSRSSQPLLSTSLHSPARAYRVGQRLIWKPIKRQSISLFG